MQVLTLGALPIYLPYDTAPVPLGDAIAGVTCTAAAPGVFTTPDGGGYVPKVGDAISLTFTAGGALPAPFTVAPNGTTTFGIFGTALAIYYVSAVTGSTFSLALTKGGASVTTTTTGSNIVVHLMSGEVDGVVLPFKPNNTVVAENNTGGSLTISTAPDSGQAAPGQGYNPPAGPGSFTVIATIPAGAAQLVVINNDWIKASGTIILQQN